MKKDNINPSHYKNGKIECIDALEAATIGKTGIEAVCTANVIKYLWRYEDKNGKEDVQKAVWYINKLMNVLTDKQDKLKGDAVNDAESDAVNDGIKGINSNFKPVDWSKEKTSVPITLIGSYLQDNHLHEVYYVDADWKDGDPAIVEKSAGGGTIQYKYRNDADIRGKIEVYREVKNDILHIYYYCPREKQSGDVEGGVLGLDGIRYYTYKPL